MKFQVREGFVVAYTDRIKQGDKTVEREYSFYPEDGAIDLDKAHATAHAHKLEPADKEGKAFLESLHVETAAPAAAPGLDIAAIIAAAVQAGLAAASAAQQQNGTKAPA